MKKILFVLFTLLNIVSCATAQNKDRQSSINTIFSNMELDGIDTKQPMLYGYFFFDKDKSKLENLKSELLKQNYKLVRLEKIKALEYILHVEKVEVHSRASLLERENQLDMLAQKYKVENYDGWDVGNADPSKPLVSNTNFEQSLNDKSDAELYSLADGFYNNDTFDKAIIVFQKCIDRNYKLDTSYYKQGVSYLSLEAYPTGIKMLEEALKLNPGYFKACFNIGVTCYDLQDYKKSIEYYQKAAALDPKDDRVYYGIAASQFVLGQLNDAEANCITALKLNPTNTNAKVLLEKINKGK